MSLIQSLKKLLDPQQAKIEEARQKMDREQPKRDNSGDAPRFVCRLCDKEGPDPRFCSHCLAETMVVARVSR